MSKDLDFPVGYVKGGTKVWIRTASDIQDVWRFVQSGSNVLLWCNGVEPPRRAQSSSEDESVDDYISKKPKRKKKRRLSALDIKNNRVEDVVASLR